VPAAAKEYKMETEMTVYMADGTGELTTLLADEQAKGRAIANIVQEARNFQGVHIDFEGLGMTNKGESLQKARESFTAFIRDLSGQLKAENLTLGISLHPLNSSYKGYDYAALGKLVDQVVIMAYDYNPQSASPEQDDKVMQAVRLAKEAVSKEKLLLGINFAHENPKTVINKVGIAKQSGIRGIALWRLGLLSDEMWTALRTTLKAEK
jgi:spore germination protein YaaH